MSMAFLKKTGLALRWLVIVVLLTVVLLEAVLQVAAVFIDKHDRQSHWLYPERVRVLALGDSNTYGLYLQANQAYPALLEKQWNAHHPDNLIEVINLGFPGTNSSRILKSLPDVIKTFSPDVITVMVGVNDFWMAPVNVEGTSSPVSPVEGWLRDHSRVYKLIYLLQRQAYNASLLKIDDDLRNATFDQSIELAGKWRAAIDGQSKSPFQDRPHAIQYGDKSFDIGYVFDPSKKQNLAADMKHNFERMADITQASHVKLAFITYAYFELPQKVANQQMQLVSKERNVVFINAKKKFREQCELGKSRCDELFSPDFHPSLEGHQLLAAEVEPGLELLLQ